MKKFKHSSSRKIAPINLVCTGVFAMLTAGANLQAADPPPDLKAEPKKWDSVATAGVTLTRGNSKTFLGSLSLNTKRTWTDDEVLFGANAGYGENTTTGVRNTTDSYVKGFGQWNHFLTPKTYVGLRLAGDHDDVANLTYRATVSPLIGYYFVKQTNQFLAGEMAQPISRRSSSARRNTITLLCGLRSEVNANLLVAQKSGKAWSGFRKSRILTITWSTPRQASPPRSIRP